MYYEVYNDLFGRGDIENIAEYPYIQTAITNAIEANLKKGVIEFPIAFGKTLDGSQHIVELFCYLTKLSPSKRRIAVIMPNIQDVLANLSGGHAQS